MIKGILLASVLGFVSCTLQWNQATTTSIFAATNFKVDLTQQGDLGWSTIYDGSKDSVSQWQHEAYGLRMWCTATF